MFPQRYGSPEPGSGGKPGRRVRKEIGLSLFDLEKDVGETTNVTDQHPEVVARLTTLAETMRKDLGEGKTSGPGRRPIGR